ncbi:unnamed protein product [Malus baccata var. baccata]
MVLKIGKRGNTNNYASNLPPGPWKLPFIGNLHQLISCLPHHGLRDLAEKYGPLMHLRLGEVSTIVVSSAEFVKEVMKTDDVIFASRPQILATRILSYGSTNIAVAPYELLSTKRVQSYRPVREEEVLKLIKSIALRSGSAINLTREIYSLTYSITSRAAFAGKVAGGFALADLYPSVSLLHLVSGIRPKLERLHKQADRIMENIINEHQKDLETTKNVEGETVEDLVHVLLKFHEHGGALEFSLTTNNIKAVIFLTNFGGNSILEAVKAGKASRDICWQHNKAFLRREEARRGLDKSPQGGARRNLFASPGSTRRTQFSSEGGAKRCTRFAS